MSPNLAVGWGVMVGRFSERLVKTWVVVVMVEFFSLLQSCFAVSKMGESCGCWRCTSEMGEVVWGDGGLLNSSAVGVVVVMQK